MIPVNEPLISPLARTYVRDCLRTGWISAAGPYITRFEKEFAAFCGTKYAVTTTSGTTALHLALASLGIGPGDEVILPALTIISCALAVVYLGATPVVVDVEAQTGNIDPDKIETAITSRTKVIMPVHLFGHPANLGPIHKICRKHHLFLVEDAAEAHGALYKGKPVGSVGDVGCFSFYGNKIISTGEGGMIVTNSKKIYETAQHLKDLAHYPGRRFYHQKIGYNYRMTNLQAALGLAQLQSAKKYIAKKRAMAQKYNQKLKQVVGLELPVEAAYAKSVYWMYALRVGKNSPVSRDRLRRQLKANGVDTREFFYPLSKQPALTSLTNFRAFPTPVAEDLSNRGLYLPSGLAITNSQIEAVSARVNQSMSSH